MCSRAGLYANTYAEDVGYQGAWLTFAFILVAMSLPTIPLMMRGDKWRARHGPVKFHADL